MKIKFSSLLLWSLFGLMLFGICFIIGNKWLASFNDNQNTPNFDTEESQEAVSNSKIPETSSTNEEKNYTLSGYYAAPTEALFDRMSEAIAHKDTLLLEEMENDGLIYPVYPNQEVVVLGCHGLICSKINFRYKGKSEEHWTFGEAITKK